jgi:thiol-disulfide isomerase/thioredoxin
MKTASKRTFAAGLLMLLLVASCSPPVGLLIAPGATAPELKAGQWLGGKPPAVPGKLLVIDVFATWCGPCAKATPKMIDVYEEFHPRGVEFIAITPEATSETDSVNEFIAYFKVPWPVGVGATETIDSMGVTTIPMVIVIGADGKVLSVGDDEPRLRSTLSRALAYQQDGV